MPPIISTDLHAEGNVGGADDDAAIPLLPGKSVLFKEQPLLCRQKSFAKLRSCKTMGRSCGGKSLNWISVADLEQRRAARFYTICSTLLLTYLLGSVVVYMHEFNNSWVDALYFTVVTLTTVGYGDIHPETTAQKVFGIIMTFIAVSFIAGALGVVIGKLVDEVIDEENPNDLDLRSGCFVVGEIVIKLMAIVIGGALPYGYMEGKSWIDSIYWASITVTTVGYGDQVPDTSIGRLFACFYIPIGTLLTASALSKLVSIPLTLRQQWFEDQVEHQFGKELTVEDFKLIHATVNKLGIGVPEEEEVTMAEFTLAMLISLGKIDVQDLAECRKIFTDLDGQKDGVLTLDDIMSYHPFIIDDVPGLDAATEGDASAGSSLMEVA